MKVLPSSPGRLVAPGRGWSRPVFWPWVAPRPGCPDWGWAPPQGAGSAGSPRVLCCAARAIVVQKFATKIIFNWAPARCSVLCVVSFQIICPPFTQIWMIDRCKKVSFKNLYLSPWISQLDQLRKILPFSFLWFAIRTKFSWNRHF